ncbi:MAG: hypothetical protein QOI47_1215 [Actinomycetota bacterium]|nr:hypothetical protein [Actinomycetota bacterium]
MILPRAAVGAPAPDLAGAWPIVGRTQHVTDLIELLSGSATRCVVLGGAAGVGKTRLLTEVLRQSETRGLVVARVAASRSASSIPFGAIAPLLPIDDLLADSIVGVLQRAARALVNMGNGRPVLLGVDDAHLLDDASATLVHQLALDGSVRLLLAIRSGEQVSASLASVVNDPSTGTVELLELARDDVEAVARLVLGGDVDGALIHALWESSQGNALYLREMLVASAEDGSLQDDGGVWRLVGRPTVPGRLVELIESRLATATDAERDALELLAVGHRIGRSSLEDVVGTDVVSHLVQRGLVDAGRDARRQPVRLHHPLYEETLRRRMPSRRLRATQLRLADLIDDAGLRRRDDRLLVTTLRLDGGGHLDAALIDAAAMEAYYALDIGPTDRLPRAGVAAGAGPRLRRVLGEIMRWQGRHDEAEAILRSIAPADLDERERALTAIVRAENLFRGTGDHEAADRVLRDARELVHDQSWRDEIVAMGAVFTALSGDVRTALATATPIIDAGPSRAFTIASTAAIASLTFAGRADDATTMAETAFMVAISQAPQESQAVAATHIMERCLGLVESGRLDEIEAIAQMTYDWSLASGHQIGQAWFSLLLARSAQHGGRLEEAVRRYRESALVFRDLRDHGIRRWALAGLAQSAAALGRVPDAAMALDELDTAPFTAVRLLEAEVLRARGWVSIARGARSEGRRILLDGVDWAATRGQHGLELTLLHDLVRVGDTRDAAERAEALAGSVQGQLAVARGEHAAGARVQDGRLLDDACERFAGIAANLFAAEAAAHAAVAHRRAGHTTRATASAARRDELAARCDGAITPALDVGGARAAERLTARELEIATLAARGRSSRDIAAELAISVRTVNNQLQRAYVKLGISDRRSLAEHLGQL